MGTDERKTRRNKWTQTCSMFKCPIYLHKLHSHKDSLTSKHKIWLNLGSSQMAWWRNNCNQQYQMAALSKYMGYHSFVIYFCAVTEQRCSLCTSNCGKHELQGLPKLAAAQKTRWASLTWFSFCWHRETNDVKTHAHPDPPPPQPFNVPFGAFKSSETFLKDRHQVISP